MECCRSFEVFDSTTTMTTGSIEEWVFYCYFFNILRVLVSFTSEASSAVAVESTTESFTSSSSSSTDDSDKRTDTEAASSETTTSSTNFWSTTTSQETTTFAPTVKQISSFYSSNFWEYFYRFVLMAYKLLGLVTQ